MTEVAFILTSCGRLDLLEKTLRSFMAMNQYPISQWILIDDSGNPKVHEEITRRYGGRFRLILNEAPIGQIPSIDKAYALTDAPYIFHCEDDWEFTRPDFIRESLAVLQEDEKFAQVWCRNFFEVGLYDYDSRFTKTPDGVLYRRIIPRPPRPGKQPWLGFSLNPGVLRASCYATVGPFAPIGGERKIGIALHKAGYRIAVLEEGAIRHLGRGRRITPLYLRKSSPTKRIGRFVSRATKAFSPPILQHAVKLAKTRVARFRAGSKER